MTPSTDGVAVLVVAEFGPQPARAPASPACTSAAQLGGAALDRGARAGRRLRAAETRASRRGLRQPRICAESGRSDPEQPEDRVEHGRLLGRIEVLPARDDLDVGAERLDEPAPGLLGVAREWIVIRQQHLDAGAARRRARMIERGLDPGADRVPRLIDRPPAGNAEERRRADLGIQARERPEQRLAADAVPHEQRARGVEAGDLLETGLDLGAVGHGPERRHLDPHLRRPRRELAGEPRIEVAGRGPAPAWHDEDPVDCVWRHEGAR